MLYLFNQRTGFSVTLGEQSYYLALHGWLLFVIVGCGIAEFTADCCFLLVELFLMLGLVLLNGALNFLLFFVSYLSIL